MDISSPHCGVFGDGCQPENKCSIKQNEVLSSSVVRVNECLDVKTLRLIIGSQSLIRLGGLSDGTITCHVYSLPLISFKFCAKPATAAKPKKKTK